MDKLNITYVSIHEIKERDHGQRTKLENIDTLADSIKRVGLIHPIVIDEHCTLIAGGRRLAAHKALSIDSPDYSFIATVQRKDLSPAERKVIELEENMKRNDLHWMDEVLAVVELDDMLTALQPNWIQADRSSYVGYSLNYYSRIIRVGLAVRAKHTKVMSCENLHQAAKALEREAQRLEDNVMNELYSELSGTVKVEEEEDEPQSTEAVKLPTKPGFAKLGDVARIVPAKPKKVIQQGDFIQWSADYSGSKFNLIHCDFPYGIDHGNSAQGGAKGRWDAYADGEDVYWELIKAMLANRDRIMLPNCHMIFWFSMKFYTETIQCFNELAPELDINYMPLIWHKTDNKGIIRDANHTPRHVYETALFITRGDRRIIKAVGDAYGAPTRKSEALHISEKPVPVLRHFMQLCVDGYSEVLDPTAGSGTAIRAANSMGAKRVLGLELNAEYAESAQREFEKMVALESLRKDTDNE